MKVLIACEFSGTVRDAFIKKGHDTWSCDLLETESDGPHIQGDVIPILNMGWDLMIAHPPCTYLTTAGARWFINNPQRYEDQDKAVAFFLEMVNAPIDKICIENPQGYINTLYRRPDQTVHPYYFGDDAMKRTCLWLKNLPKLKYELNQDSLFWKRTAIVKPKPLGVSPKGKKYNFCEMHFGDWKARSKFWPGIANAMAEQWG